MSREHFKILFSFIKLLRLSRRRNVNEDKILFANLRRCCHILDKGIHMVPFEKGHGISIFKEANRLILKLKEHNSNYLDSISYKWCENVLLLYEKAQIEGFSNVELKHQYIYNEEEQNFIKKFLDSRISCRIFNKSIIDEIIWEKVIALSQTCPNSCCRQTTKVYIIKDKQIIDKVASLLGGATCFSNGIPYLVCFSSQIGAYSDKDVMLSYIDSSIFAGTFVIAARAYNIQSVLLNYQHAYLECDKLVHSLIGVPKDELITLFCACGRVDSIPLKPSRLDVKNICKFR